MKQPRVPEEIWKVEEMPEAMSKVGVAGGQVLGGHAAGDLSDSEGVGDVELGGQLGAGDASLYDP